MCEINNLCTLIVVIINRVSSRHAFIFNLFCSALFLLVNMYPKMFDKILQ